MINPAELAELREEFADWLLSYPEAGVIMGTLDLKSPEEGFRIDVGSLDFTPLHWVALADAALEHASRRFREQADAAQFADFICSIERARAMLDFEELKRAS